MPVTECGAHLSRLEIEVFASDRVDHRAGARGGEHRAVLQACHVGPARRWNHPLVHDLLDLPRVHSGGFHRTCRTACSTMGTPTTSLHACSSLPTIGPGLPLPRASPLTLTTGSRQYVLAVNIASSAWYRSNIVNAPSSVSRPSFSASSTDRKSTRLNSSHITISYAVFCL